MTRRPTRRPARRRYMPQHDQTELLGCIMLGSVLVAMIGTPILYFIVNHVL
jgi:hypothetical protein